MRHQLEVQSRVGSQSSGTSEKAFIRKGIGDYAAQEKIAILKRHLLEKLPVSVVCNQYGLDTETFYSWQDELFQNGALVFDKQKG